MLGIGWTEMLVIGVVALIVIGPKDLPVVMKRVGQFAAQIRRMGAEFQREINKTTGLDEVRNLRKSITDPLRKSTEEIRREFNAMTPTGPKPSGAIKPAIAGKESVAEEIRAAAGMPPEATPAETTAVAATNDVVVPVTTPPAETATPKTAKGPVKAKRVPLKPVAEAPAAALAPPAKPAAKRAKTVPAKPVTASATTAGAAEPVKPPRKPRTAKVARPTGETVSAAPDVPASAPEGEAK